MEAINYKKLLVPFDFTPEFKHSLRVAEEIAGSCNGSITLLFAMNSGLTVSLLLLPYVEKALRKITISSELPTKRFEIKIFFGSLNESIISYNTAVPHDLILVPNFLNNNNRKALIGLDALKLMKQTRVPVISVNEAHELFKIRNILLPVRDVKGWFKKIPFTMALAKAGNAKITVLGLVNANSKHPITRMWKKLDHCRNYLAANYDNFEIAETHICSEPYLSALDVAQKCNADIISVTAPQRNFKFRGKQFYDNLISDGKIPVFSIMQ
jgi:hypothetical protein